MIFDITRQTFSQIRSQWMLSVISIIGTALAIFLIMVVVMMQDVRVVPFSPESNRDRFLHARAGSITSNLDGEASQDNLGESNGSISYETAIEQFGKLKTPEAVTIYISWGATVYGADCRENLQQGLKPWGQTAISGKCLILPL